MIEDKQPSRTSISSLGEFKLIKHLTQNLNLKNETSDLGVGDDAAVISVSENNKVLVSTDFLVEGIHFNLSYMPLKHLGYKAVVVNLSDIYAMNAVAHQITVSIAVSNRFTLEAVEELYEGIKLACKVYGVDLVGGDTTSSQSGMVISITAIGQQEDSKIVKRGGAKNNDLLVVSGDLGAAYMGFQVLERERQVFEVNPNAQPDLEQYSYLVERQLKPEARKDVVQLLKELEVLPTSMIDISDGLSSEILHLTKASGHGCKLYEDKIPLDPQVISSCEEFQLDSTMVALSGGEDYELLFTVDQNDFEKIKANPNFSIIGHMTEDSVSYLMTRGGGQLELKAQGWDSTEDQES
jgi:thiamine-monophosphate kinase